MRDAIRLAGNFAFCDLRRERIDQRIEENQLVHRNSASFSRLAPRLRQECETWFRGAERIQKKGFGTMKLSNRTLLAGLIVAVAGFSGAAQATTLFSESFEGNLSDWTSMSKKAEIVAAPGGGKALAFAGTYGGGDLVSKAELSSTTGKYTVSFDLEDNCGHTSQCGFFFGVGRFPVPQAGWLLADTSFDISKVLPVSNGGWERVSFTFAAGNNIQLDFEDWNGSAHAGSKSFFLKDLQATNDPNHLAAGTLTVTGVPEPSSWALTLAGFAAIGFVASRRNKTVIALDLAGEKSRS